MSRRTGMWGLLAALWLIAVPAWATDTVYYFMTDTLHSTVVVTDQNRNVVEETHYAPYGRVLNRGMRDGPGYAGHTEDPATGLVYMQQRYYDPQAGRFLSTDPVQAGGGNVNRYWYASDNPYRYTDPTGEWPLSSPCRPGPYCGHAGAQGMMTFSGPNVEDVDNRSGLDGDMGNGGSMSQAADAGKVASSNEYTRRAPSDVSQVESDPAVQNWEDQARHSEAFNARDERKRHEEGMWAYPAMNGSGVKIVGMPAATMNSRTGLYSSIDAGAPPLEAGYSSPIAFHTHPFPIPSARSVRAGYIFMAYPEPSQADVDYARAYNIDGVVISHTGNYYFGVSVPSN